jgi:hypothetical protein
VPTLSLGQKEQIEREENLETEEEAIYGEEMKVARVKHLEAVKEEKEEKKKRAAEGGVEPATSEFCLSINLLFSLSSFSQNETDELTLLRALVFCRGQRRQETQAPCWPLRAPPSLRLDLPSVLPLLSRRRPRPRHPSICHLCRPALPSSRPDPSTAIRQRRARRGARCAYGDLACQVVV